MFEHLHDSIRETIDRVDGFSTGTLVVDLAAGTVLLDGQPLSQRDHIEVRNYDGSYRKVTVADALSTIDHGMECSLYAGLPARVKIGGNA